MQQHCSASSAAAGKAGALHPFQWQVPMRIQRPILFIAATVAVVAAPAPLLGQNITLKTVPIPTGEQFLLFPSQRMGMGSVHIGADDTLAGPFSNPARRLAQSGIRAFTAPTFYGEANNWVGGRTLPFSVLFAGGRLHGGVAVATQQLNDRGRGFSPWLVDEQGRNIASSESDNGYIFGSVGYRVAERTSVGASIFHGDLGAVDGVNMLYGRAAAIEQSGGITELRAGMRHDFGGDRTLEGTITRTHLDMSHTVHYVDWRWDPMPPPGTPPQTPPTMFQWREHNDDNTISWGSQFRYRQPLDEYSHVGVLLGGTTKAHPKIPNYNIVDIPRDPGNSAVFNIGVGLSRQQEGATFAMDLVVEPGRSHTWAYADTVVVLESGARLQPGDKTVDNQFRFLNWSAAVGGDWEGRRFGAQLGLRTRRIAYSLDQHNFLAERRRETRERWSEWTPSWGAHVRFGSAELRYSGRLTARGWPQTARWFGGIARLDTASPGVDFVVGPTGTVSLPEYRVTTHRIMLSMPFGP
jgi:hypothetical protein